MGRVKGNVPVHDNTKVKEYLGSKYDIYDYDSYHYFVDNWVDDVIRGSTGQMSSTKRPSQYKVYFLLSILDKISVETVGEIINAKRMAVEGVGYSTRYIQTWVATLRCASEGIAHQLHRNKGG